MSAVLRREVGRGLPDAQSIPDALLAMQARSLLKGRGLCQMQVFVPSWSELSVVSAFRNVLHQDLQQKPRSRENPFSRSRIPALKTTHYSSI